jgi:hypothetical protein
MNPFGWIASVVKAGKRLADALNRLAGSVEEIDAGARRAFALPAEPLALPAPKRGKAGAVGNGRAREEDS